MEPPLWKIVRAGSFRLATHACFAAAVQHSPLIGDYLDLVVREKYRTLTAHLSQLDWASYIEACRTRDPAMTVWSDSTVSRLRSTVHSMLARMGYLDSVVTLKLQSAFIEPEVLAYLEEFEHDYVLRCLTVRP